jgi:hypothetical protein
LSDKKDSTAGTQRKIKKRGEAGEAERSEKRETGCTEERIVYSKAKIRFKKKLLLSKTEFATIQDQDCFDPA